MTSKGHALSREELVRTLTAYTGITSADGAADGTTLVDSNLKDNAFIAPASIPEKTILIITGDARGEDKGAASFDNATGTITLQGTGFNAQIKAGTIYRILNISSVEIDVAAINAKIGSNTDPSGTTTLFARLRQIVDDYLASASVGLTAIKNAVDAVEGKLDGASGLAAIKAVVDAILVDTGTTLETKLDNIKTVVDAILVDTGTTLEGKLDALALICTAARGLLIDRLSLIAAGGAGELTAARAGYLDNINQAGLLQLTAARAALLDQITALRMAELDAANIPADVDGLKTSRDRQLFSMDFWSDPQEEVVVTTPAGTLGLPSVTIADLPGGATIMRAIVMFKARMIENINAAANNLDGATVAGTSQVIQVKDSGAGAWVDAINFVDNQFGIGAGPLREGGDVLIGSIDVSGAGKVDANDTYSIRWLLAKADLASLNFNDCACGLRIWYLV